MKLFPINSAPIKPSLSPETSEWNVSFSCTHLPNKCFVFLIYLPFSPPQAFRSAKCTFSFHSFLVLLRYAARHFHSFVLPPLFKRNSRISSMFFIVCSAIPLYQLQFWATEVISFCIGGSEEQRYVRPRAAYLSNANRLDLSKSHWNHITYSSSAKYLQNEEGVKTGDTNISIFFLSPHGQTPFYPLTFVFAWQRVGPPTVDSPEWAWGCGPGSGLRGKTACLCRCCSCGTDMEPV